MRGLGVPRILGFAVAKALFLACCFLPAGGHCQRVLVVTTEQNTAPIVSSVYSGTYAFSDLTAAGLPFDVRTYGRFMTIDMTPYDVIILNGHTSPVPVAQVAQKCRDLMAAGKRIFINGYQPFASYDVTGTICTQDYYADELFGAQPGGQFWVTGLPTLPASLEKDPMITAAGVSNRYIQTFSLPSPAPVEIRLAGKLIGFVGPTGGALRGYSEYEFNLLDYGKLVNYIRHGDAMIVGFANDRVDGVPIVAFHTDCHVPSRVSAVDTLDNLSAKYGVRLTNTLTYAELTSDGAAKWNSVTNPLMAVGSHSRTHPNDWTLVTNLWSETGQAIADTRAMIPRTLNFLSFTGSKNPTVAQLDQLVQWGVLFDGQGIGGRRCPWPDDTYHQYQVMPINGGWLKNLALCQYTPTWPSETLSADNEVCNMSQEYDKVMAEQYAQNCKYGMYSYGFFHDTYADPTVGRYVNGVLVSVLIDRAMQWFHDQGVHSMFPHELIARLQDYVAGNITYAANPDASITITATRPGSLVNEIKVGFKGDLTPVADPGPSVLSQTLTGDCVYIKLPAETTSTVQVRWEDRPPVAPVVKYAGTHISTASVIPWEEPVHPWGIAEYQYAVGTTPGATDAQSWLSAGTSTSGVLTQANLQDGETYYVSVRSRYAGTGWSAPGVSRPLIADTSPPTTPIVVDGGLQHQVSTDYLYARWSSNDPQTGVVQYCYAIGTQPGDNSVLDWTYTTNAEATATGLNLQVGRTYYFSVKAENGVGFWSAIGASDGITIIPLVHMTVGLARREPEGTHILIDGVVVTAAFANEFYVESPDRSAGIKVISDYVAYVGEALDIDGYVYRDDVERIIEVMSITPAGSGSVEPVWMTNRALGGTDDPIVPGATGATGLNNVGLLVKAVGKILGTGTDYILIDDGSKVPYIGTQKGVRVSVTPPHSFYTGSYVAVTGISNLWQDYLDFRRMIRTRSNSDIQVLIL